MYPIYPQNVSFPPSSSILDTITALEDANLDLLVYAGSPANPSYKYNLETNNSCPISNFPANIENPVSGSAFGHPISCGGNTIGSSAVDQCWIYHHQTWMPEVGMLTPRTEAAATVINDGVGIYGLMT